MPSAVLACCCEIAACIALLQIEPSYQPHGSTLNLILRSLQGQSCTKSGAQSRTGLVPSMDQVGHRSLTNHSPASAPAQSPEVGIASCAHSLVKMRRRRRRRRKADKEGEQPALVPNSSARRVYVHHELGQVRPDQTSCFSFNCCHHSAHRHIEPATKRRG